MTHFFIRTKFTWASQQEGEKRFVGKLGPSWADETPEGNGEMCGAGRGEASGGEEEVETALGAAMVGLLPPSEASGAVGEALLQVEGVEGGQMRRVPGRKAHVGNAKQTKFYK